MSLHLLEAWHKLATKVVTLYHGTNQEAFDSIVRDGEFRQRDPEAVNHAIERRYNLPHDSVWRHKYNTFSHGRMSDQHVYFSDSQSTARQYAQIGSEVVNDALSAAWHLLTDPFDEEGNYKPGMPAAKKQWMEAETRAHYKPVVIEVEVPWEKFKADVMANAARDLTYEEAMTYDWNTVMLKAPIPASWIVGVL